MTVAALRIQKFYRQYKAKKSNALWRVVNDSATLIQRQYRMFKFRRAVAKRHRLKAGVQGIAEAWRTRRALNCLASEVQQYVNCENPIRKHRLRLEFNLLF